MDLLSVIRRWHGRDKLSIREITRRTGLSRNTFRKYLANGTVEPRYPARKSVSKLDPYAEPFNEIALPDFVKPEWCRCRKVAFIHRLIKAELRRPELESFEPFKKNQNQEDRLDSSSLVQLSKATIITPSQAIRTASYL